MRDAWSVAAIRRRLASKTATFDGASLFAAIANTLCRVWPGCSTTRRSRRSNFRISTCATRVEITAMPPMVTASSATTRAISLRLSDKLVADPEDGGDRIASELLSEVLDVRIDGAVEPLEVIAHGQARQLVTAEDAAGRLRHRQQQAELGGGERDRRFADRDRASHRVDGQASGDDARRGIVRRRSAKDSLDARHQLARAE